MADIGYYTLPVILSFKGIDQQVNDALGKTLDQTVPKQINKSVNDKITKQIEASTKTVGKKIGTQLNTAINPQQVGKDIGTQLNTGITKAIDPKKVGTEVSKQVAQGFDPKPIGKRIEQGLVLAQNLDTKKIGKTISDNVAGGIDAKHVGSVLKDVLKQPLSEAKKDAIDYGKTLGHQVLAGDIKGAATDVGNTIQNTTANVNQLGKAVGVNLDGVEKFGRDTAQAIDGVASTVQHVYDTVQDKVHTTVTDVQNVNQALRGIGSGDVQSRIQSVSTLLSTTSTAARHLGVDISGVTAPVENVVNQAADFAGLASQVQDLKTSLLGAGPVAPRVAGAATRGLGLLGVGEEGTAAAGAAIGTAFGPAIAAAAILAGGIYLQHHIDEFWPSTKRPGEINQGPYPTQTPEEGARAAAALPPTPGPPRPGYSWQMGPNGQWVETPLAPGTPSVATPGYTPPPGAPGAPPPPPPAPPPASDLAALNKARAAQGLPPLTEAGAPAPVPARVYGPPLPAPAPPLPAAPAPVALPPTVQRVPGMAEATTGVANIHASSANVSIGSANISGVSIPTPYTGTHETAIPGKKSWFQSGGAVPIIAHTGEHMLTVADVAAMGGQASVYNFRNALHRQGGGSIENQPVVGEGGNVIPGVEKLTAATRQGNVKFNPNLNLDLSTINKTGPHTGISYELSKLWSQVSQGYWPQFDEGGEIKQLGEAIAGPVAKAAAEGAAKGAEGAAHGAGAGMALPAILGGPGGQQMGADVATSLLGIGAGGVGETLGLGTMFPDPMQNPNVKSLIALASAFKGPIMGAMKGKLGIQQPGWKPGMPVNAMAGDTGAGASIGLPFGLPSIDLPNAPEGGAAPPGGGPVGGGDTNIDASLNIHGDVGNEKAVRDHQQQIQRGLDRLAPMPTGPN